MKRMLLLSSLALMLFTNLFAQADPVTKPTNLTKTEPVSIRGGIVVGTTDTSGIQSFKGIPFAAPPVGGLRWKAPQPVQSWTGIKRCTEFGPSPMQSKPSPFGPWTEEFLIPKEPISEDCLYLNVWTASASPKVKKPVLVWIYGGGFSSGGSGVPVYDGTAMAAKGIVFVSMNYRVGIFGFFAHPELTKESGRNASGNYGLMDQVAALQWVKDNIAAFGGDPANVTLAGQSAGSMSVHCLVASPLAKGLFQKAIAESGAVMVAGGVRGSMPLKKAEENGEKIMHDLSVRSIQGLREFPAEELLKKAAFQAGPIIDGYVLPGSVSSIFAAGKQNDVALLTGWNEDDGVIFGQLKTAADFRAQVAQEYPDDAAAILKFYPATSDAEAAASQARISRDKIFGVQNYAWANSQGGKGKPVYVYRFARKVPATGEYAKYGAFHTGEVPYVFDNLKYSRRPSVQTDHALAKTMSKYWANFIASGNPNAKGLAKWPLYTPATKQVMVFNEQSGALGMPDAAALDLLQRTMEMK
jgi:para-nitrobenzyl esterase